MKLALGLILSPIDFPLFPQWLEYHSVYFDKVIVAVDCSAEVLTKYLAENMPRLPHYKLDIFSFPLNNDFASMRNAVVQRNLSTIQCDWLVFLDCDEELLNCQSIRQDIENAESLGAGIVGFPRINFIGGIERKDLYPDIQWRGLTKGGIYVNMSPSQGASPGCHETIFSPNSNKYVIPLEILHTKDEYRFRHKGYLDQNSTDEDIKLTNRLTNRLKNNV
jgi:glycosyltransferase involved in cell wall biosynthesis